MLDRRIGVRKEGGWMGPGAAMVGRCCIWGGRVLLRSMAGPPKRRMALKGWN